VFYTCTYNSVYNLIGKSQLFTYNVNIEILRLLKQAIYTTVLLKVLIIVNLGGNTRKSKAD
jgi:hypothetical protein